MIQSFYKVFKFKSINNYLIKCLIRSESSDVKQVLKNINHLFNESNDKSNQKLDMKIETIGKSFRKEIEKPIETDFEDLDLEKFSTLITNNEIKEKIETILSEYEYEKYTTLNVPKTLSIEMMRHLLSTKDSFERQKTFNFFKTKETKTLISKMKKIEHSIEYWSEKKEIYAKRNCPKTGIWDNSGKIVYGLWHNSLFTKIISTSVRNIYVHRLRNAALFGQKLVIDLDYDKYMNIGECNLLAKQLRMLYRHNKYEMEEPFDLHFTNCNPEMPTMLAIPRHLQHYNSNSFMAPFHRQSYLDLFPKQRLVYLTPFARESLVSYNHDDIYIIGGIIDKSFREPVSYVKAKKEGIRTVRLPIDEHILWSGGTKHLCLNHIHAILGDVKKSGDWKKSLKDHIPKRKQKKYEQIEYEDILREERFRRTAKIVKYF